MKKNKVKIGVIGLGYVGLPLAIKFSLAGINTIGFDTDKSKVKKLNNGKSYIRFFSSKIIKKNKKKKFFCNLKFFFNKRC